MLLVASKVWGSVGLLVSISSESDIGLNYSNVDFIVASAGNWTIGLYIIHRLYQKTQFCEDVFSLYKYIMLMEELHLHDDLVNMSQKVNYS